MERATELLLQIAGGKAGPIQVAQDCGRAAPAPASALRRERIGKLLGTMIADNDVKLTLESLGMRVLANATTAGW